MGNNVGEAIFTLVRSEIDSTGEVIGAALEGLLILLRLGLTGLFGLLLLYFRRGSTPRQAGLSRNGQPLAGLLWQRLGIVLVILYTEKRHDQNRSPQNGSQAPREYWI
jgi:hypothetical protein